jgi:hypothetical protein
MHALAAARSRLIEIAGHTLRSMVDRPTAVWRADVAGDAADLAAGVIGPEDAVSARLWPDEMIRATDVVLDGFEADVAGLADHRWEAATDAEVLEVVERTVRALNAVNNQFRGAAYETDERELLCEYIDRVLGASGIEADELARRNGFDGGNVTGPWRDW